VWGAPTRICLRQYINIKDFYPDNVNFFCRALNVSNFNLAHIIGEMCSFQYGDNIQHIAQVFEVLDEYLKRVPEGLQHLKAEIGEILSRLLFPVRFGNSADPRGYDRLATGVERPKWFIADRLCFDTSFAGRTSLLAFDYDVNIRLGDLFVHMGLGDRRLSKVAKKTAVPTEPVELNPKFTSILRSKMDFVIR
jgi:hypothetical protein